MKGTGGTVDVLIDLVQDPEAMFHPSKCVGLQCVCSILILNHFTLIPGLADFGGDFITTFSPIPLRAPFFGDTSISVTLALDNVGQEGTERGILRMRISEDSEQPVGTFFKRDLKVTIFDASSE